jgi:hypothetical protein
MNNKKQTTTINAPAAAVSKFSSCGGAVGKFGNLGGSFLKFSSCGSSVGKFGSYGGRWPSANSAPAFANSAPLAAMSANSALASAPSAVGKFSSVGDAVGKFGSVGGSVCKFGSVGNEQQKTKINRTNMGDRHHITSCAQTQQNSKYSLGFLFLYAKTCVFPTRICGTDDKLDDLSNRR